jgi:hypothetical protein
MNVKRDIELMEGFYINKFYFIYISIIASFLFLLPIIFSGISEAQSYFLDCSQDYYWGDCSSITWIKDSSYGYDDNKSLRSGPIKGTGYSSICRNFQGPGEVKFKWRTDISPKLGTMVLFVDGIERNECNSTAWIDANYSFRSDKIYFLEWRFIKNSADKWKGHGWIDDIIFSPSEMPQLLKVNDIGTYCGNNWQPENKTSINKSTESSKSNPKNANLTNNFGQNNAITRAEKGISNPDKLIFPSIQQAIDNATENGSVFVCKGNYEENIIITKPIELIGFYNSTIKYMYKEKATIQIRSNGTKITGLTVEGRINASISSNSTISTMKSINITGNIIDTTYPWPGITLMGFSDWYIINNTIKHKLKSRNKYCIYLDKIPENLEGRIYGNRLSYSEVGVRAPLSTAAEIRKNFNKIINLQCSPTTIGEEVFYE